jgi:hypothetical protein
VKLKGADVAHHESPACLGPAGVHAAGARFRQCRPGAGQRRVVARQPLRHRAARPDEIVRLEIPRMFKPCGTEPHHIDFLYSEVVLLDLKIQ